MFDHVDAAEYLAEAFDEIELLQDEVVKLKEEQYKFKAEH